MQGFDYEPNEGASGADGVMGAGATFEAGRKATVASAKPTGPGSQGMRQEQVISVHRTTECPWPASSSTISFCGTTPVGLVHSVWCLHI